MFTLKFTTPPKPQKSHAKISLCLTAATGKRKLDTVFHMGYKQISYSIMFQSNPEIASVKFSFVSQSVAT